MVGSGNHLKEAQNAFLQLNSQGPYYQQLLAPQLITLHFQTSVLLFLFWLGIQFRPQEPCQHLCRSSSILEAGFSWTFNLIGARTHHPTPATQYVHVFQPHVYSERDGSLDFLNLTSFLSSSFIMKWIPMLPLSRWRHRTSCDFLSPPTIYCSYVMRFLFSILYKHFNCYDNYFLLYISNFLLILIYYYYVMY